MAVDSDVEGDGQTLGLAASGGADALLGRRTLDGLAANDDGDELSRRRLDLRLGYGFGVIDHRFTMTPEFGFRMSQDRREYGLGWRLTSAVPGDPGFEIGLDATGKEPANNAGPEHGVMFRGAIRW